MYTKYNYMYRSTILSTIEIFVIYTEYLYSYISMYSKYNYMYKSTILSTVEILLLYHNLIQVCILNIITHFLYFYQLTSESYRFPMKINRFVIIVFEIESDMG